LVSYIQAGYGNVADPFLQCTSRGAKKEIPDGNRSLTFSFHNGERKGGEGGGLDVSSIVYSEWAGFAISCL
jgi:hypothetical protein